MVSFNIWYYFQVWKTYHSRVHHQLKQFCLFINIRDLWKKWWKITTMIWNVEYDYDISSFYVVINGKLIIVINLHCTVQYRLVLHRSIHHRVVPLQIKCPLHIVMVYFGMLIIHMLMGSLACWYHIKPLKNISIK